MEKRLLHSLESLRSDFADEGVHLDLWSREAFLHTADAQGNHFTITVSTAFADAGFYISVQGIASCTNNPEMHQIRDTDEIVTFLHRRINQIHGKDPDEEVILPRIEAWAGSRKESQRWYRDIPIPSLGGLTPQQTVARGRMAAVLRYIEHIEQGGYA